MGWMRFVVRPPDRVPEAVVRRAYLAGLDRVPWPGRVSCTVGPEVLELRIERAASEAASLHIPWPVENYGWMTLSTGTLMEREEPFALPLELARGKIGQVRNQLGEWSTHGLAVPPDVAATLAEATRVFGQALSVGAQAGQSVAGAERALSLAVDAAHRLASAYSDQAIAARRPLAQKLPTRIGVSLGPSVPDGNLSDVLCGAFNTICVPIVWRSVETSEGARNWDLVDRQIQWCQQRKLCLGAGPLVQLDSENLPDWLHVYHGDAEAVADLAAEFAGAAVARYRGRVDYWIAAGRVNTAEVLSPTEEDKVRLAARLIEQTRLLDAAAEVIVTFDQPWAEYLSARDNEFPPLHIADALVRAGLGLTGLGLELNLGYGPGGASHRDPVEFSRLVDSWSALGAPLYVAPSVPGAASPDVAPGRAMTDVKQWSAAEQQAWVCRYVPLLLAKPAVHAVVWTPLNDGYRHDCPHAGLLDATGRPKPALAALAALRQAHLL